MNLKSLTLATAIGSLLAAGVASANHHEAAGEAKDGKVKCYGIVKAGKNDCATSTHSCAGASKTDDDPAEWKYAPKAECENQGGKLEAPAQAE